MALVLIVILGPKTPTYGLFSCEIFSCPYPFPVGVFPHPIGIKRAGLDARVGHPLYTFSNQVRAVALAP